MNELNDKINSHMSAKTDKRRFSYLKKNNRIDNKLENNQTGILNKLSERLSYSKEKVSAFVKEVPLAVRKKKRINQIISSSTSLPDVGRLDSPSGFSDTSKKSKSSILGDDTSTMARRRRLLEQDGHRQLAKVHAREHQEEENNAAPEGELQNSIKQHPFLLSQRFDGIDPNVNPEPPLNTAARREYDNAQREQEMEKQLRLGNMPKFSSAPKPKYP
jgi:hypothetical protein